MTPRQLAQYLQVSPSTLARQMRAGLPHFRVGGQLRFIAGDVVNHFRAKK
jgi:predicted site-specific integrase-resolvase